MIVRHHENRLLRIARDRPVERRCERLQVIRGETGDGQERQRDEVVAADHAMDERGRPLAEDGIEVGDTGGRRANVLLVLMNEPDLVVASAGHVRDLSEPHVTARLVPADGIHVVAAVVDVAVGDNHVRLERRQHIQCPFEVPHARVLGKRIPLHVAHHGNLQERLFASLSDRRSRHCRSNGTKR